MKGKVAKVVHRRHTAKFLVNYLFMVLCVIPHALAVVSGLATTIMKKMKQPMLFGFNVCDCYE